MKSPDAGNTSPTAIEVELRQLREENKHLRELAGRPAKYDEEDAKVSWRLGAQLFKQAQEENEECAYWFVSALSKLASSHPHRPMVQVLWLAKNSMPKAAKQYADYAADKC